MAVTATVTINLVISGTGALAGNNNFAAAANTSSPNGRVIQNLASGANTITPPGGGSSPTGCIIIPPAGNVTGILLKKVTGDTGIDLHLTNPSYLALGSPTGTFVLTAAGAITGVTLIWT